MPELLPDPSDDTAHRILDSVVTADDRELALSRRGNDFVIRIGSEELMTSRAHGSEEELARLALATLGSRPAPRVLVAGLGMGFTLRATLDALVARPGARVVVCEVFPAVVAWNRGPLAHLARRPLDDPRVEIAQRDVGRLLATAYDEHDLVLMDVDNGPDALTLDSNRRLYGERGLQATHRALTPGGVLAVWSASDDRSFTRRLRRVGFEARAHHVRERPGKGAHHVIFVARKR
ncbi:MAG TPA: hypothetical protein VMV46_12900 [Thermoanaerobaculia bacterium]|nr:hypothetical protein [Thermoanaerobaculia bacterium]